nr:MAG TPA: hypothetical protein [Caudoviricetes sp.]
MAQCMLTTFDNPYNPFDDFTKWWLWDVTHGYNSCALLARVSGNKDELTDEEQSASIEKAIDSIIDCDFFHVYKKVKSENESSDSQKIVAQTKEKEAVPA